MTRNKIGFKSANPELEAAEKKFRTAYNKLINCIDEVTALDQNKGYELMQMVHNDTDTSENSQEYAVLNLSKLEIAGLAWYFERLSKGQEPNVKIDNLVIYNSDYAPVTQTSEEQC